MFITAAAVMGDEVMNQPEAWSTHDRWLEEGRVVFMDEPPGLDDRFRTMTRMRHPTTKDWADSYLAALAGASQCALVTFDQAIRRFGRRPSPSSS